MKRTIAALVALLAGCAPDLSDFEIVETAATPDAGPRMPAEPDFGTPCTDPHVAITVQDVGGTGLGEVRRFQLPSLEPCRESALARSHGALGSAVYAIAGLPDGTEVVGVDDAVLKLDAEGFPVWRQQLDRTDAFLPLELFTVVHAGAPHVVAAYWGRGTTADGLLLLDLDGNIVHEWTEGTFGANSFAPDPTTPGNLLISRYGDVHSAPIDTATDRIADGTEIRARDEAAGTLITIDTEPDGGRVIIAYEHGVVVWTPATGEAWSPVSCPAPCGDFHAATWDPSDPDAALALCNDLETGRTRHLVRVHGGGGCTVGFDGTFLSNAMPTEVAIIP